MDNKGGKTPLVGCPVFRHDEVLEKQGVSKVSLEAQSNDVDTELVLNANWDEMFIRLAAYKDAHGDCFTPNRYSEDPQLGNWGMSKKKSGHYSVYVVTI